MFAGSSFASLVPESPNASPVAVITSPTKIPALANGITGIDTDNTRRFEMKPMYINELSPAKRIPVTSENQVIRAISPKTIRLTSRLDPPMAK